ncbi:hypothetical protein PGB90_004527 [Kerria lacca]
MQHSSSRKISLKFPSMAVRIETGSQLENVTDSVTRQIRSTPDWSDQAINGDHLWVPTTDSGDFCYAGEVDCTAKEKKENNDGDTNGFKHKQMKNNLVDFVIVVCCQ